MSDGMSDGRNYGPSLSKHGPPLVSRDGRPVKCNACGVEGVHPIEICLSMVRSELEVAKLQVADLRKFVERIVTDYGCPYSAQGEFDCAEGKCSACDGYRMVNVKPNQEICRVVVQNVGDTGLALVCKLTLPCPRHPEVTKKRNDAIEVNHGGGVNCRWCRIPAPIGAPCPKCGR